MDTNLNNFTAILVDLVSYFKISIWIYDNNNEKITTNTIDSVYKFIKTNKKDEDIIVIGNSKGCSASLYLCSEHPEIKAAILISPILNIDRPLPKLNCATFLIQGKKDKKANYMHTNKFGSNLKNLFEWYPKNGGHSDIFTKYRTKLFSKLKIFFDQMHQSNTNKALFSKLDNLITFTPKNFYFKFEDNFIINEDSNKINKEQTFNYNKYNKLKFNEEIDEKEFDISRNCENIIFSNRKSTCPSIMDYDCPFDEKK